LGLARKGALTAGGFIALLACAAPAPAQTPATVAAPSSQFCRVFALDAPSGQPRELRAACRDRGIMLGLASQFQVIVNEALRATLVDIRWEGQRRLLLLSMLDDGAPLVEDLTGQLALAAGRGPMSSLEGVEIDLGAFTLTGEIGVRGRPEDDGAAKTDKIAVGPQLAAERVRRAAATTAN
jgi:hypothetical protein